MVKDLIKNLSLKTKIFTIVGIILLIIGFIYLGSVDGLNLSKDKECNDAYFGVITYTSDKDKDEDGVDDQKDMLSSAKAYVAKKPKYKEDSYYKGGYPNDGCGTYTDVITFGMLDTGYNLKKLIYDDIIERKKVYNIPNPDENIEFRRIKNIVTYLDKHSKRLNTELKEIDEWQAGDIVVFKNDKGEIYDAGVLSDKRNENGYPYVIHHTKSNSEKNYEEDILSDNKNNIHRHYRMDIIE